MNKRSTIDSESELSKILDESKLSDLTSSVRLRDFYKQLLKTDASIRRLKKSRDKNLVKSKLNFNYYPEREKRSIKFKEPLRVFYLNKNVKNQAKRNTKIKGTEQAKHKILKESSETTNKVRNKRFNNATGDTIVFEKNQFVIQYKPRKMLKCLHSPNEQRAHERHLKHAFDKNTQRLDELLEQFSKNLPKLMNDQFGIDINIEDENTMMKIPKLAKELVERITDKDFHFKGDKSYYDAVEQNDLSKEEKAKFDAFEKNILSKEERAELDAIEKNDRAKAEKAKYDALRKNDLSKEVKTTFEDLERNVLSKEEKSEIDALKKNAISKAKYDAFEKKLHPKDDKADYNALKKNDLLKKEKAELDALKKNVLSKEDTADFDFFDKIVNSKQLKTDADVLDKNVNTKKYKPDFDARNKNVNEYNPEFDELYKNVNPKEYKTQFDLYDKNVNTKQYNSAFDILDKDDNTKEYKTDFDIFRKMRNGSPNMEGTKTNGFADFDVPDTLKKHQITTPQTHDSLITMSTALNPNPTLDSNPILERMPNMRRILQVEDDDQEGIGYEDFKEILTDDNDFHDDDEKLSRRKRDEFSFDTPKPDPYKYHPPNLNNPNWKGAMPLYSDEINSMIQQGPTPKTLNSVTKAVIAFMGKKIIRIGKQTPEDEYIMDYNEDYSDTRYDKLAKLAQAYSDYGVLSDKKEAVTDRQEDKLKDKPYIVHLDDNKRIMKRRKTTGASNNVKIEESQKSRDEFNELYRMLSKHIKITNENEITNEASEYSQMPSFVTPTFKELTLKTPDGEVTEPIDSDEHTKETTNDEFEIAKDAKVEDLKKVLAKAYLDKERQSLAYNDGKSTTESVTTTEINTRVNDKSLINVYKRSLNLVHNSKVFNDMSEKSSKLIKNANPSKDDLFFFKNGSLKALNDTNYFDDVDDFFANKGNAKLNTEEDDFKIDVNLIFKKRSLKSFNDSNDFDDMSEVNSRFVEVAPINHTKAFNGSNEMNLSAFFSMLANVFSAFDESETKEKAGANTSPHSTTITVSTTAASTARTTDVAYPMYDSDMIENVGHRSRVLLSINSTEDEKKISNITLEANAGSLSDSKLRKNLTLTTPINEILERNKTVVKRNAKTIWNDIYDDEYGVKMDLSDNIQEKRNKNDFIRRSNDWVHDKVKKIGDNIYSGYGRIKKSRFDIGNGDLLRKDRRLNRIARQSQKVEFQRTDFNALTAHMKDVCKQAARAVRESRQKEEAESKKDGTMTTGLMKQLVSLMSELIDYQVQQKTCMKLPPDLHSFLEWLTAITPEDTFDTGTESFLKQYTHDFTDTEEKSSELPSEATSEREDPGEDLRSDCLGTFKAVQDLLTTYDNMLDEDKSKMTGVKDYLTNQMKYLRNQIPAEYLDKVDSNIYSDPNRYKRQLSLQKNKKHGKFLKNYSKKHTKTTVSFDDEVTFSENFNKMNEKKKKKDKRNLRDIYYKAVSDAKTTTAKTTH